MPKIFLKSFENVAPGSVEYSAISTSELCACPNSRQSVMPVRSSVLYKLLIQTHKQDHQALLVCLQAK